MKRHFFASMTACATMLFGFAVQAAPMLSLSSSTNLNTLAVGQSATINVLLTGLTPGQQLQELLASVSFDPTIFMQPGSVTPGPIIPNTAPPFFQTSTSVPGFVDGLYDTGGLGAPNLITTNGVFYSFTLKAIAQGAGSVSLDAVDALFFNPADPFSPISANVIAGATLPVTIGPAGGGGGAVPLPAGLNLGMFTIGILALGKRIRACVSRKKSVA